jgi:AcrR family transcriptional regulator
VSYKRPHQTRALMTEQRFLDAFAQLLSQKSFHQITIDEIALASGLHRGAFLARFGSKKQALLLIYERYCIKASKIMLEVSEKVPAANDRHALLQEMSQRLEQIQEVDFAANRAMHEFFMVDLQVDPRTKKIFVELIELMKLIQRRFGYPDSNPGPFAAAQLLVSINYNYVLNAMTALPKDAKTRHALVASLCLQALDFPYHAPEKAATASRLTP